MNPPSDEPSRASPSDPRAAFDDAYARLGAWVRRLLRQGTGDAPASLDDLSQRVWAGVWASMAQGRYDPRRAKLTTFVYAVAINVRRQGLTEAARAHRRAHPRANEPLDPDQIHDADDLAALSRASRIDAVRDCLARATHLGLSDRDVQVLRAVGEGRTDRELAEQLGVAPSTAHTIKRAALDRFRAALASRSAGAGMADAVAPERPARTDEQPPQRV